MHGINNWSICQEPKSNKYDRYSSTLINIIDIKNENQKNKKFEDIKILKEEEYSEHIKNLKIPIKRISKFYNSSKLLNSSYSFKIFIHYYLN